MLTMLLAVQIFGSGRRKKNPTLRICNVRIMKEEVSKVIENKNTKRINTRSNNFKSTLPRDKVKERKSSYSAASSTERSDTNYFQQLQILWFLFMFFRSFSLYIFKCCKWFFACIFLKIFVEVERCHYCFAVLLFCSLGFFFIEPGNDYSEMLTVKYCVSTKSKQSSCHTKLKIE